MSGGSRRSQKRDPWAMAKELLVDLESEMATV
jgi:hypothetical protein